MAGLIELDLRPDEDTLRRFGWIALGGFGLLALLAWREWLLFAFGLGAWRMPVVWTCVALGLSAGLLSWLHPRANRALYVGLSLFAFPIGLVLSQLIVGVLFFGLITPLALVFRVIGRDPLQRRFDREAESYWVDAHPPHPDERYFRQY